MEQHRDEGARRVNADERNAGEALLIDDLRQPLRVRFVALAHRAGLGLGRLPPFKEGRAHGLIRFKHAQKLAPQLFILYRPGALRPRTLRVRNGREAREGCEQNQCAES